MNGRTLALLVLAASVGCQPKADKAPSSAPSASAAAAPIATTGIDAAGNDAKVVTLMKGALACSWPQTGAYPADMKCPAWQVWIHASDERSRAKADTYLNMIEDADPRVRVLAMPELALSKDPWWTNVESAKRVLAAASKADPTRGNIDAYSVGLAQIDYAKTGLWPDAKALIDGTPIAPLRVYAIGGMLRQPSNANNEEVWSWVKAKTVDPDAAIAKAGVHAFTLHRTRAAEACAVLLGVLGDDRVAGAAAQGIAFGDACAPQLDPMLASAETRRKAGTLDETWPPGLAKVVGRTDASAVQKKRATEVLVGIASASRFANGLRVAALKNLVEADKVRGQALAATLTADKDPGVATAARSAVAQKP